MSFARSYLMTPIDFLGHARDTTYLIQKVLEGQQYPGSDTSLFNQSLAAFSHYSYQVHKKLYVDFQGEYFLFLSISTFTKHLFIK